MKLLHQIYRVIFIFQCFLRLNSFEFPYTSTIQKHFLKQFVDTCSKYPFVQQWVNKLEYPGHRQVMFVFDEPGLNNGGFGDRLAGLLGAVGLALRFNRTLVLRDSRGLANYFRPYHPVDIHSPVPKYTWDKYLQWSNYNVSLANNDATEYDLYYCINNGNTKSAACSMEGSDVSQPIILLRSNRAYFCRYEKYPDTAAFHEMTNVLGLNNTSNLYEAAGCMLRLALWPTRSLWIDADRSYYDDLYARLLSNQQIPSFNDKDESQHRKKRYLRKENSKKDDLNSSDHRSLLSFEIVDERDDDYTSPTASTSTKTNDETSFNYFHQIGIHFRCGDHSYSGAHDAWDCEYDPNHPSNNIYMLQGNPYFLATCGKEVLHNYTLSLIQSHSMVATGTVSIFSLLPISYLLSVNRCGNSNESVS